jgi:SAM-dependent methyltransferase
MFVKSGGTAQSRPRDGGEHQEAGMTIETGATEAATGDLRQDQVFGADAWDARHRSRAELQHDGDEPSPLLAAQAAGLPPGRALDAGAGTGADACWLADRGWQVTGVDHSPVALEAAATRAARLGHDIAWLRADLAAEPAPGTFDLVTSHYLCVSPAQRPALIAHLTAAVAPGGTLLLVGHAPATDGDPHEAAAHDHGSGHGHATAPGAGQAAGDHDPAEPHLAEVAWNPTEVAGALGPGWTIMVAETRPVAGAANRGHATHDSIVCARREPARTT